MGELEVDLARPALPGAVGVVVDDAGGRLSDRVHALVTDAPARPVVLRCDALDVERAIAAVAAGASAIVTPDDDDALARALSTQRDAQVRQWRAVHAPGLLGEDPALVEALATVRQVCDTDAPVLVGGESGTGKELIAQALHAGSRVAHGPFVAVNCAAIPEELVEAELFGHTRGAFTGAVEVRKGRIQAADGGTLFLDEIGDMPAAVQAKLLRVLQDGQVTPVGADRPVQVRVRVVAASHRDLAALVDAGRFRADLYYRLSVVEISLPPLRERRGDVLVIACHLARGFNARHGRAVSGFDAAATRALVAHRWPGNVRELSNAISRAVAIRRAGLIGADDLQLGRRTPPRGTTVVPPVGAGGTTSVAAGLEAMNLRFAVEQLERTLIERALAMSGGNRAEAAALLGLNRTTLVEKLRRHG